LKKTSPLCNLYFVAIATFVALIMFFSEESVLAEESIKLTIHEQAWLREHKEIRLGVDPAWHPMEFIDQKGQHKGISSDYVRLLNERLGLKMQMVPNLTWKQVIDAVFHRDVDVLPGVAKTQEREKHLTYTEPYMYIDWVIVSHTDTPTINSLADLKGRLIAVNEGYVSHQRIKKNYPEIPLLLEKTNGRIGKYGVKIAEQIVQPAQRARAFS